MCISLEVRRMYEMKKDLHILQTNPFDSFDHPTTSKSTCSTFSDPASARTCFHSSALCSTAKRWWHVWDFEELFVVGFPNKIPGKDQTWRKSSLFYTGEGCSKTLRTDWSGLVGGCFPRKRGLWRVAGLSSLLSAGRFFGGAASCSHSLKVCIQSFDHPCKVLKTTFQYVGYIWLYIYNYNIYN